MNQDFVKLFVINGQQVLYRVALNDDEEEVLKATIYAKNVDFTVTIGPFKNFTAYDVLDTIDKSKAKKIYNSWYNFFNRDITKNHKP